MAEPPSSPSEKPAHPDALAELVVFRNVTKSFGKGPQAKVAIQDVSFAVHDMPNRRCH